MLYAQLRSQSDLPMEWDEVESLAKHVTQHGASLLGYQFIWEKCVFASQTLPKYRFVIVRWTNPMIGAKKREDILKTTEPEMAVSALRMLLITVQDELQQSITTLHTGSNGLP